MCPCPCLHVHVSMSQCLNVSMSQCLHVSLSIFSCFQVSISLSPCLHLHASLSPCLYVSRFPQTENRTDWKWQLPFVRCKRQTSVCLLQTENGNRKFAVLSKQTINSYWQLLFQQTWPSILIKYLCICITQGDFLYFLQPFSWVKCT